MPRKPDKRVMTRWSRAKVKTQNRKHHPPIRGKKCSLQEQNHELISRLEEHLRAQAGY